MALQTALARDRAKGGSSKARQEPRGDDITVTTVLCSWRRATMDRGIAPPPTSVFVSAPDFASKSVAVASPRHRNRSPEAVFRDDIPRRRMSSDHHSM